MGPSLKTHTIHNSTLCRMAGEKTGLPDAPYSSFRTSNILCSFLRWSNSGARDMMLYRPCGSVLPLNASLPMASTDF
jgi:hypothetical protein